MSDTRKLLEKSWRNALCTADREGVVRLQPAAWAGWCLASEDGDPFKAIARAQKTIEAMPESNGTFYRLVQTHLEKVRDEEQSSRGPVLDGTRRTGS
jgi:hypothetical protein